MPRKIYVRMINFPNVAFAVSGIAPSHRVLSHALTEIMSVVI